MGGAGVWMLDWKLMEFNECVRMLRLKQFVGDRSPPGLTNWGLSKALPHEVFWGELWFVSADWVRRRMGPRPIPTRRSSNHCEESCGRGMSIRGAGVETSYLSDFQPRRRAEQGALSEAAS